MTLDSLFVLIDTVSSQKVTNIEEIEADKIVPEFYTLINTKFMDEF
jgi:hypothetical protein